MLQVYFRDMRYVVNAALTAWVYATPDLLPAVPARPAQAAIEANPVTGCVELFRLAIGGPTRSGDLG